MVQANKMILKYFLPAIIAVAITGAGALGLINYKILQDVKTEKGVNLRTALSPFIVLYALCLIIIPLAGSYKKTRKFASHAAREYIIAAMKEYPELKQFQKVLSNRRAMNRLATVISNNLRPSEQKTISETVFKMKLQLPLPIREEQKLVRETLNKVVKIVEEHELVHPEFISKVYIEMARADATYVFSQQNQTQE